MGCDTKENNKFKPEDNDYSLGYLLLRNIGNSLSKENIANVLEDTSINRDKVHPMEFYIYPIIGREFENGDIVQDNNSGEVFVILTPSCDFVERFDGGGRSLGRKAENVYWHKQHCYVIGMS